uniref:Uncharacterized protein n=1 Tax=Ditylenchus dipsaci TaxID=166011 RepID=A0A915DQD8_9BILA
MEEIGAKEELETSEKAMSLIMKPILLLKSEKRRMQRDNPSQAIVATASSVQLPARTRPGINTTKFIAALAELFLKEENFRAVCAQSVNDETLSEQLDERERYSQKHADGFAATTKIFESDKIQNTYQKPDQISMDQMHHERENDKYQSSWQPQSSQSARDLQQRPQQWWPQQFGSPQPVAQQKTERNSISLKVWQH